MIDRSKNNLISYFAVFFFYFLLISGLFNVLEAAPPPNDNFINAIPLTGSSGQISGSNLDATGEVNELNHASVPERLRTVSVWYKWEAPINGDVSFDTNGSDFDTVLAVYTGTSLENLTETTSNDDDGLSNYPVSTIRFQAVSGTLYYIAVDGSNGDLKAIIDTGSYILNWTAPTPVTTGPDSWEEDDTFTAAQTILLNSKVHQLHWFHDSGDEDWVKFYATEPLKSHGIYVTNLNNINNIIIELYAPDGTTMLKSVNDWGDGYDEVMSFYCLTEGIYYIKIKNVDPNIYGDDTEYQINMYIETGTDYGALFGTVKDPSDNPIKDVRIKTTKNFSSLSLDTTGWYSMEHEPGTFVLTAECDGYKNYEESITLTQLEKKRIDIVLEAIAKGDINGNDWVDLEDVVLGLKLMTGTSPLSSDLFLEADVNSDERIGQEDVIWILQTIAQIRN